MIYTEISKRFKRNLHFWECSYVFLAYHTRTEQRLMPLLYYIELEWTGNILDKIDNINREPMAVNIDINPWEIYIFEIFLRV